MRWFRVVLAGAFASGVATLFVAHAADGYEEWQKDRMRQEASLDLHGLFTSMKIYSGEF